MYVFTKLTSHPKCQKSKDKLTTRSSAHRLFRHDHESQLTYEYHFL